MYFVVETPEEAAMLEQAQRTVWDGVLALHGTAQHELGRRMQAALEPVSAEILKVWEVIAV